MTISTLPFKQKEIYLGLAEIRGLLRVLDEKLEIEYIVKDTSLGLLDSNVKVCSIPFSVIDSVEFEETWFSVKVEFSFNRIPDLPYPFTLDNLEMTLTTKKKHLQQAKSFRSALAAKLHNSKRDTQTSSQKKHDNYRAPSQKPNKRDYSGNGLQNMLRDE